MNAKRDSLIDDITVEMLYRAIRKRALPKRASGAEED
jgi:hypothetical protein